MTDSRWSRRRALGAMASCAVAPAFVWTGTLDGLLIRDVRLVDGSGAPSRHADVLVRGGRIERIERIGRVEPRQARGLRIVEGDGRALAPGRGTIRPGATADLVPFDPPRVRARSGYADRSRRPKASTWCG